LERVAERAERTGRAGLAGRAHESEGIDAEAMIHSLILLKVSERFKYFSDLGFETVACSSELCHN
jgi:hypothetical protein